MDNRKETKDDLIPPLHEDRTSTPKQVSSLPKDQSTKPSPRIGFRELVPGSDQSPVNLGKQDESISIPEFDLGQQMMAPHRRMAATKRRGPGRQINPNDTQDAVSDSGQSASVPSNRTDIKTEKTSSRIARATRNPLIAEIVRRDIERLCKPRQ